MQSVPAPRKEAIGSEFGFHQLKPLQFRCFWRSFARLNDLK